MSAETPEMNLDELQSGAERSNKQRAFQLNKTTDKIHNNHH